ncbi:Hypothetical predicted protein [Pelobates cultripes]|uniref:Uncharacterized protein n=1 Tax=Pelobates cultripes TaxID=61616 RepID=A0AAD1S0U5_PELCU|nr:Hypothetical predicted protein [Pelobates cultripes]CAH2284402.1 Hypothetical predicted protein [Pelobates cultripes]
MESSETESEQEEILSESDDEDLYNSGAFFHEQGSLTGSGVDPKAVVDDSTCLDPQGEPLLGKAGWKAKKGLDFSLRKCQDKILDVLGPSAKFFNMVETALAKGTLADLLAIRGWIQRSICLIGIANTALSMERRKAILIMIEPKLVNLAISEPRSQAKGLLFGDKFVEELGSYVGTFMVLDKAQANTKQVFSQKVLPESAQGRQISGPSARLFLPEFVPGFSWLCALQISGT